MNKVYCFDFDGVLCNSIYECFIVAYNAYYNKNYNNNKDINKDIQNFFYKFRYLAKPAKEFFIIFYAFEKNFYQINREIFDDLKNSLENEIKYFDTKFYKAREKLKEDIKNWLKLHIKYDQFENFLEKYSIKFNIVTNKDKDSVIKIAKHHGYLNRIDSIYSKEISNDKNILFDILIKEKKLDLLKTEIVYVDDQVDNLENVQKNIKCLYLADWGYNIKSNNKFKRIYSLNEIII